MSDFVDRLIERSFGLSPMISPLTPSIYTPKSNTKAEGELQEAYLRNRVVDPVESSPTSEISLILPRPSHHGSASTDNRETLQSARSEIAIFTSHHRSAPTDNRETPLSHRTDNDLPPTTIPWQERALNPPFTEETPPRGSLNDLSVTSETTALGKNDFRPRESEPHFPSPNQNQPQGQKEAPTIALSATLPQEIGHQTKTTPSHGPEASLPLAPKKATFSASDPPKYPFLSKDSPNPSTPHRHLPAIAKNTPTARDSILDQTPPTIRVSIGRIEVRTLPATPPPQPPVPSPAPQLSLDEYLQLRQGGQR